MKYRILLIKFDWVKSYQKPLLCFVIFIILIENIITRQTRRRSNRGGYLPNR